MQEQHSVECDHTISIEVYTDKTFSTIAYYRCAICGKRSDKEFGSKFMQTRDKVLENEKGPVCPYCGKIGIYLSDIDWFFNWHTCSFCGHNSKVRKKSLNPMYETKKPEY